MGWAHWMNDNERRVGDRTVKGSIWRQGRLHWRYGKRDERDECRHHLEVQWIFFRRSNNAAMSVTLGDGDGNDEVGFHIGLPWLLALYVSHSFSRRVLKRILPWYEYGDTGRGWSLARQINVYWFEGSLWWSLWTHPMDGDYGDYGRTKLPRWRKGSFSPADFLLGSWQIDRRVLTPPHPVIVPMPEGAYPGWLKVEQYTRYRKRTPWRSTVTESRWIDLPIGVPESGKGENSWDCGEDGVYGTGSDDNTDEATIGYVVGRCLASRWRRDRKATWPVSADDRLAGWIDRAGERGESVGCVVWREGDLWMVDGPHDSSIDCWAVLRELPDLHPRARDAHVSIFPTLDGPPLGNRNFDGWGELHGEGAMTCRKCGTLAAQDPEEPQRYACRTCEGSTLLPRLFFKIPEPHAATPST